MPLGRLINCCWCPIVRRQAKPSSQAGWLPLIFSVMRVSCAAPSFVLLKLLPSHTRAGSISDSIHAWLIAVGAGSSVLIVFRKKSRTPFVACAPFPAIGRQKLTFVLFLWCAWLSLTYPMISLSTRREIVLQFCCCGMSLLPSHIANEGVYSCIKIKKSFHQACIISYGFMACCWLAAWWTDAITEQKQASHWREHCPGKDLATNKCVLRK